MFTKAVLVIFDGLGDRPLVEMGGLTPLEAASTPNLDALASRAECGLSHTLGRGVRPGSDVAHIAILGYDLEEHFSGRGTIEAAGVGLELKDGDVALRGNFGTVDGAGVITDRRAGRILDVNDLVQELDGIEIEGVRFLVKAGTAHRAGVVMRGPGLSCRITDADPHDVGEVAGNVRPLDDTPEAAKTANVLNRFLDEANRRLTAHPVNIARASEGKLPANYLLVRGAGMYRAMPCFEERHELKAACVAGGGLYKGIGRLMGMDVIDVEGATGLLDTDVAAKSDAVITALEDHDFVFLHIKAADSLGEDGDAAEKKAFIERSDAGLGRLLELSDDVLVVVTADHSTPCALKNHSADPVPIMYSGADVRADSVTTFGERSCSQGYLGHMTGADVMPHVLNLLGRLHLVGA